MALLFQTSVPPYSKFSKIWRELPGSAIRKLAPKFGIGAPKFGIVVPKFETRWCRSLE